MTKAILDRPIAAVAVLVLAMLSIQGGASFAKGLFPIVGAQGATSLRLGIATIIMMIILRPWKSPLSRDAFRPIIIYGCALGGMNLLFYLAIRSIPLGIAVSLEFVGPLTVALVGSRRLADLFWAACALFGIILILPNGLGTASVDPLGAVYAVCAGGCWAIYIVVGKRAAYFGKANAVTYGTLVAAILTAPVGFAHAGMSLFSLQLVPLALTVAVLTSAIPFSLEMVALSRLPTPVFGILTSMEPALGAISGFIFLQEHLAAPQILGIVAIMAASIGVIMRHTSQFVAPI